MFDTLILIFWPWSLKLFNFQVLEFLIHVNLKQLKFNTKIAHIKKYIKKKK